VEAKRGINHVNRAFGDFYQDYDVYLTPTTAGIAPEIGANSRPAAISVVEACIRSLHLGRLVLKSGLLQATFKDSVAPVPFTQLANLSGLPSISLPPFQDENSGLPVGVMLTAALGRDASLLQLARQVEIARP